jgi:hypothetical protein
VALNILTKIALIEFQRVHRKRIGDTSLINVRRSRTYETYSTLAKLAITRSAWKKYIKDDIEKYHRSVIIISSFATITDVQVNTEAISSATYMKGLLAHRLAKKYIHNDCDLKGINILDKIN